MQFTYQARDMSGKLRQGELVAASLEEATRIVRKEGLYLLSMGEVKTAAVAVRTSLFQKRVPRAEVIYVTSQLAVMIDAGVPLATALEGVVKQTENSTLRESLEKIQRDVQGGDSFSTALARFPRLFDRTYVNLVRPARPAVRSGRCSIASPSNRGVSTKRSRRFARR
jgi:type II secretory pathway component PulF